MQSDQSRKWFSSVDNFQDLEAWRMLAYMVVIDRVVPAQTRSRLFVQFGEMLSRRFLQEIDNIAAPAHGRLSLEVQL